MVFCFKPCLMYKFLIYDILALHLCISKERWMSGLNQRFTKPSSLKQDREFESRSLRQNSEFKFTIKK